MSVGTGPHTCQKVKEETQEPKTVNLEKVLFQFDHWQDVLMTMQTENCALQEKLAEMIKDNQDLEQSNKRLQKETTDAQAMISNIHQQLNSVCNLEDEVQKLKSQNENKESSIRDLKKHVNDLKTDNKNQTRELTKGHRHELKRAIDSVKQEDETQIVLLNELIKDRDVTIGELKDRLLETEKENQAENVRIRMEYENKLTKLQRQKAQHGPSQTTSSTQEIFRKKMQHMKAETEKEISSLKQTVADLQQKIVSQSREPTKLSLSMGKKRRY